MVHALVRRGYRVTYVTSAIFASDITTLGAEVLPCPSYVELSQDGRIHQLDIFGLSDTIIYDVVPFYMKHRPDLVLYDRALFAGRILARRLNIPAITTFPGLAFNRADISLLSPSLRARRELEIQLSKSVEAFFGRYGIHAENSYFHEEKLNIYLYPKIYQLSGDLFGDNYFYAGRCAAERPYYGSWKSTKSGDRPIVVITKSTAYGPGPEYFKMCITALSGSEWHVLLVPGENFDSTTLGPLPPHFEIVQDVPQVQMLPHAHLLICAGGVVTATEAMYHGVPLLMVSQGNADLEAYSENAARLGIGIHLWRKETTAESIRAATRRILNDTTITNRVREVQKIVQREPGGEEAANRIEEYFGSVNCGS